MESRIASPVTESRNVPTDRLVTDFKEVIHNAKERAVEQAKAADQLVRSRPYQTIGVAIGLGVLIGALASRRWRS